MTGPAHDIARRLAENAEAVCRRYLSKGRREGQYWLVGDVHNTPGRSLYLRLVDSPCGRGKAGKWTDAKDGKHGDLLDIIAIAGAHRRLRDTLDEARRFLSLPLPPTSYEPSERPDKAKPGSPEAAKRLWAASKPLDGSVAKAYLARRSICHAANEPSLRSHPRCYYRPSDEDDPGTRGAWPALIGAVTDEAGRVTGVHRTWLDPDTCDKAALAYQRRAMGHLLGHGIRFGGTGQVMAAGEGIETILSLREIMASLPMIAATSAAHLAAMSFPAGLRRLYVAVDADDAGAGALATLQERGQIDGIEIVPLEPVLDDFNSDLTVLGCERLARSVRPQLVPVDAARFLID